MASLKAPFKKVSYQEHPDLPDEIAVRAERLPMNQAQIEEVERRLAEYDADPTTATPWEIVHAELLRGR